MNASINGQVDDVNWVDIKIESVIHANPNITIFEVMGNQRFASEIPHLELEIDRAKFHMKLAGISKLNIDLSASDVAFNGATDAAKLY